MGRPYASELDELGATLAWAAEVDIALLADVVARGSSAPLVSVGSGGSLSAAHLLTRLHRHWSRRAACAVTPLEIADTPPPADAAVWLLSAGGKNSDILSAHNAIVRAEPRRLVIMTAKAASPLVARSANSSNTDIVVLRPPGRGDGFLATNSLAAFSAALTRAYRLAFGQKAHPLGSGRWVSWGEAFHEVADCPEFIVLHGTDAQPGAVDMESRFAEAALGPALMADYRNFGHGRHHWLAKRPDAGVVAFVSNRDRSLAERTLRLLPTSTRRAVIGLDGEPDEVGLQAILASIQIAGWRGQAIGIDPGRPGVPEFGRKLYGLKPPSRPRNSVLDAAIRRKCRTTATQPSFWVTAAEKFVANLTKMRIGGVVLDYDGTVVDVARRREPPSSDILKELTRLIDGGIRVAIATGRGDSVRECFRRYLPAAGPALLIGYHNGAEVGLLNDDRQPGDRHPDSVIEEAATLIGLRPDIMVAGDLRVSARQLALTALADANLEILADAVTEAVGALPVRVVRSTHSVDVLAQGVSKARVLDHVRQMLTEGLNVVCVGDCGDLRGNDYDLLHHAGGLSAGAVSSSPLACWNLAPEGSLGPEATLLYLKAIKVVAKGEARIDRASLGV